MTRQPEVSIIGLGLIGGSLALRLSDQGWTVRGWDRDPAVRRRARRLIGLLPPRTLDSVLQSADLVVLAAPPVANGRLLAERIDRDGSATVTDVGSVKREIARHGRRFLGERFVPGHPMAGSESEGLSAARADLFEGAPWIVCGGGAAHRRRVRRMIRAVGATPHELDPEAHDRDIAAVSHLLQIVTSLTVGEVLGRRTRALEFAGPAFHQWGRLAGSPPKLWAEILRANADNVGRELDRLSRSIAALQKDWEKNENALLQVLERGRRTFDRLEKRRRSLPGTRGRK